VNSMNLVPRFIDSRMDTVSAHTAHLRHLARPSVLQGLLQEKFLLNKQEATRLAFNVSPFIDQGLHFHDASKQVSLRVRPVLQYYAYLNLAVAVVLVYKPQGWNGYKTHGVEDLTRKLTKLSLQSQIVKPTRGAIPLFHSVISEAALPQRGMSFRELLVAIPMVSVEMDKVFSIKADSLAITGQIVSIEENGQKYHKSKISVEIRREIDIVRKGKKDPFPIKRIHEAMPAIKKEYTISAKGATSRTFISKRKWSETNKARAEKYHQAVMHKIANIGSAQVEPPDKCIHIWRLDRDSGLLPTLSAGLLISFALSCLSRYRASVLEKVENSKFNLLCDVFTNESDGFIIPAMRNLLHSEALYIGNTAYT
jgi:hypothetical protein